MAWQSTQPKDVVIHTCKTRPRALNNMERYPLSCSTMHGRFSCTWVDNFRSQTMHYMGSCMHMIWPQVGPLQWAL